MNPGDYTRRLVRFARIHYSQLVSQTDHTDSNTDSQFDFDFSNILLHDLYTNIIICPCK